MVTIWTRQSYLRHLAPERKQKFTTVRLFGRTPNCTSQKDLRHVPSPVLDTPTSVTTDINVKHCEHLYSNGLNQRRRQSFIDHPPAVKKNNTHPKQQKQERLKTRRIPAVVTSPSYPLRPRPLSPAANKPSARHRPPSSTSSLAGVIPLPWSRSSKTLRRFRRGCACVCSRRLVSHPSLSQERGSAPPEQPLL